MRSTSGATAALLAATVVWGSTFVVTKRSLDELDPASFLAWRFGIAVAALAVVRPGAVRRLAAPERRRAVVLGAALALGFLLQTTGLQHTPAGESGFLTGAAVVLTPVVAALVFGEHVGRTGWVAVTLAAAGVAALAGGVRTTPSLGTTLTLAGAACFAVHIAGLARWATRANAYGVTVLSVAVAAILCVATAVAGSGSLDVPVTARGWAAVTYLGIVATGVGFGVQAWAQSALTATAAAVVMTTEPVAAALLAAATGEAGLGLGGWAGGLLVVAGMTAAELGPRRCCDALAPRVECC